MAWNLSGAFKKRDRAQRAPPDRQPVVSRLPPRRPPTAKEEKRSREIAEAEERIAFPIRFDENGARLSGNRGDEPDEKVDPIELAEAVADVAEFAPEAVIPMVLPQKKKEGD